MGCSKNTPFHGSEADILYILKVEGYLQYDGAHQDGDRYGFHLYQEFILHVTFARKNNPPQRNQ
jgi:hypothetical protein